MKLLYEIDLTKLKYEQYLRVYDDYIEMRKVKAGSSIFESLHPQYTDFLVRIDLLERVEYTPAKGKLATGILQFFRKGEPSKKATLMNIASLPNAFNFAAAYNATAEAIYNHVQAKLANR